MRVVAVGELAPPAQHVVHLGPARVVDGRAGRLSCTHQWSSFVAGGLSRSSRSLTIEWHTSMRKPATPRSNQNRKDVVERVADLLVPPVEVGLRREELVEVVLAARLVERPRGDARVEGHEPVVRQRAVGLRIGPHVPVAMAARRATTWRRRTTGAGRSSGSGRDRACTRMPRLPPPRRRAPRRRRWCRARDRRRSSRRRRSPSPCWERR